MSDIGKSIIILGVVLVALGFLLAASPKIPLFGKLPGDILIKRDNFTFYAPIVTSILLSIILTIVFRIFNK